MLVDRDRIEIAVVIDASSFMSRRRREVISYVNGVLANEHFRSARTSFTLVFFGAITMPVVASVPITEMPELCEDDFFPTGQSAVLDAIGETITIFVKKLAEIPTGQSVPGRVIIITLTEGIDTASTHYTAEEIKRRIMMHSSNFGWEFRFPVRGLSEIRSEHSGQIA
ncbi:MAG: hypothetical protein AAF546_07710 [Verrucomicrobiota bacterium]